MTKTLVLLANNFPANHGDTSFIMNEIDALASYYDQVLVWSWSAPKGSLANIPTNVRLISSFEKERLAPKNFLNLRFLGLYLKLLASELRMSPPPNLRHFLRAMKHGWTATSTSMAILRYLKRSKIDPVDVPLYSFWGMNCGLAVATIGKKFKRSAARLHRYDLYEEESGYIPYRWALFSSADALLTISQDGKDYLVGKYPVLENKTFVSRLGTIDRGLGPARTTEPALIVSCSTLIPIKRIPLIFAAINLAAQERPLRWIHFGGHGDHEALQAEFSKTAHANLSLEFRGEVTNPELMRFYQTTPVSVFVNLSESEGVPVSIMEALSFGIPVVATDVGGVKELISPKSSGGTLLVSDPSPIDAARAILRIIENSSEFTPRLLWQSMSNQDVLTEGLLELLER